MLLALPMARVLRRCRQRTPRQQVPVGRTRQALATAADPGAVVGGVIGHQVDKDDKKR
jgi:uncharacterized protein YcfJ